MMATAAVIGLGAFGAPAPAQAGGGTKIFVATPGIFVAVDDHKDDRRYYRKDYGYRDDRYKHKDYGYRRSYKQDHYRYRDYGRRDYKNRSYYGKDRGYYGRDRGYYGRGRSDWDRRDRRYRY